MTPSPSLDILTRPGLWLLSPGAGDRMLLAAHRALDMHEPKMLVDMFGSDLAKREKAKPYKVDAKGRAWVSVSGPLLPDSEDGEFWAWLLGGMTYGAYTRAHTEAVADPQVTEFWARADCPGGHVTGCAEAGEAARQLAQQKPYFVYAVGDCASGMYWLASPAKRIYAAPTAQLGSIGVAVTVTDNRKLLERLGITRHEVTDDAAPRKRPDYSAEDGLDDLRRNANRIAEVFRAAVATGRGVDDAWIRERMGRGGVLIGPDALAARLCDALTVDVDAEVTEGCEAPERPLFDPSQFPAPASVPSPAVPSAQSTQPGTVRHEQEVRMDPIKAAVETATAELRAQLQAVTKERDEFSMSLRAGATELAAARKELGEVKARVEKAEATSLEAAVEAWAAKHDAEGRIGSVEDRDAWKADAKKYGIEVVEAQIRRIPANSVVPTKLIGKDQPENNGKGGRLDAAAADRLVKAKMAEWGVTYPEAYDRLEAEQPGVFAGTSSTLPNPKEVTR